MEQLTWKLPELIISPKNLQLVFGTKLLFSELIIKPKDCKSRVVSDMFAKHDSNEFEMSKVSSS